MTSEGRAERRGDSLDLPWFRRFASPMVFVNDSTRFFGDLEDLVFTDIGLEPLYLLGRTLCPSGCTRLLIGL